MAAPAYYESQENAQRKVVVAVDASEQAEKAVSCE